MARLKLPVNYRSAASRTPSPEDIQVQGGIAILAEAPADPGDVTTPMVVTVGGTSRARVTTTPAAGQYLVRTATSPAGTAWLPVLEFHASDEGLAGTVDYYRTGTVYTAEWFSFLIGLLTPIVGLASKAALDAAYPASSDVTQPGRPGRMAFLADFSAYYSDGTAWRQISGAGAIVTAVDALMAATLGVSMDAVAAHVGAASYAVSSGATMDAAWAPPGQFVGALQVDAALGALLDASYVPGGVVGDAAFAATLSDARDAVWAAGGAGPLIPPNPNFDTPITATTEQAAAWWYESGRLGGTAAFTVFAGQLASTEMTGANVGRVFAQGYPDDLGYNADCYAALDFIKTKAEVDATTGVITFDFRAKGMDTSAVCEIVALDSGNAVVNNDGSFATRIAFWGNTYEVGPGTDQATFRSPAPVVNVTQAKTLDAKGWLSTRYKAGKSWADVVKLRFKFMAFSYGSAGTGSGGVAEFYIDNFR